MRRIILGLLASLLMVCSLPVSATAQGSAMDLLLRPPSPIYAWWTLKKYPSICWVLMNRPPVGATMVFTFGESRSSKPVLDVQLPNTIQTEKNKTCYCVNLKDYDIELEPDILYRWYISVAQNPESRSRDMAVRGHIQRCGEESCLIREMPSRRCDVNFVQVLARSGMWYDSISCLCDLIKSSPDDKTLRQLLDYYMWQAGLTSDSN
jgi:hypothetical protein